MQKIPSKPRHRALPIQIASRNSLYNLREYEFLASAMLPGTARKVNVCKVCKDGLTAEHYGDLVKQYRATFSPEIEPTPKADYWIIVIDNESGCCLGTIALCHVDDDSAPFVFHNVPKGKARAMLEVFNYVMKLDNNRTPYASLNDIEAGSFSIQKSRLTSFSELLDIASLVFYYCGKQGLELGAQNAILAVTKTIRVLYKRLGLSFYQFPSSQVVFGQSLRDYKQIEKRMHEDMKIRDPKIVKLILEHYLEVNCTTPQHAVQCGILNIQETLLSLETREVIRTLPISETRLPVALKAELL